MTLLLSVLHHMDDARNFLTEVSKISRSLLIEMPHPQESDVCGKDIIREQLTIDKLSIVKPEFNKLDYEASTHCDTNLTRSFYYANTPNYYREAFFPYIDYPLQPRHYLLKSDEGKATLYKTHLNKSIDLEPGCLLYDIAKIGRILFPNKDSLLNQIEKQFNYLDKQENVADVRPWNLLFSAQGLKFIDCHYTTDLTSDLLYKPQQDAYLIKNYLENLFKPHPQPTIIIDGVFFQLYSTGISRVWKSLLEAWKSTNFIHHIVVIDCLGTSPKIPGVKYRMFPPYNYYKTDVDREKLQQICDEEGADLFISTYYTTPVSTPSVFMAYDMIPEVLGANFEEPMWKEKHKGIEHASSYITISENTAVDLAKCFPDIPSELITVAHCGVDSNFSPASLAEINSFKAKYGINKPYFMAVGIASSYKNAPLFFQAFNQLISKQGFEIVCTGSGGFLPSELRDLTAGTTVHMLQLTDEELRLAYSAAVALVYPSKYEGFGLPIVEAMACGCPVITCPNASIPEVAGEAAIYVDANNIEEMANALCEVQKPAVRNSLTNQGITQAKNFSWSTMADKVSSALIAATLLPLNLNDVNLIIFPDWSQPEEELGLELAEVLKAIATHPDNKDITLLVYAADSDQEDANLLLSGVAMNLFMEEELDISEGAEIVPVGKLSSLQWQFLLPRLQARISLKQESEVVNIQEEITQIPSWEIKQITNLITNK